MDKDREEGLQKVFQYDKIIKELRRGQRVLCPECKKGFIVPLNGAPYETTTTFICENCGNQIIFN